MPQDGTSDQNLECLRNVFCHFYFSFMESFVFEHQVLFRVDVF